MSTTVPIGEFARMTYLSQKALRLYHDIGILEPAEVEPDTGYRRYALDQVATGQLIRRLRDLDMPLPGIKSFLLSRDDDERNAALLAHLRTLTGQLSRTQRAVDSLQDLLIGDVARLPVEIRHLPATTAIAVSKAIRPDDLDEWIGGAFLALDTAVEHRGLVRTGPHGALYYDDFFTDETGTVSAFVPCVSPGTGRDVESVALPASDVAVATHVGSFSELDRTYGALGTWVHERGIGVPGPVREHYLVSDRDTSDEARHRTEVCWPTGQD